MALQGKCEKCKIRWVWGRTSDRGDFYVGTDVPLRDTACPDCGQQLKHTIYYSKLRMKYTTPNQVRKIPIVIIDKKVR